jgi:putative membrane protein
MDVADLPGVNAALNASSGLLVIAGYVAIRGGRIGLHKTCMLTALGVSTAFLGTYLYYHYHHGSTPFAGPSDVRPIYYTILISHILLAIVVVPMALTTAYLGLRDRLQKHVRLARWTLPIWLYVSVTGVVVYWMLYQVYPPP